MPGVFFSEIVEPNFTESGLNKNIRFYVSILNSARAIATVDPIKIVIVRPENRMK